MYRVVIVEDDPMVSLLNRTFVEWDTHFQVVQSPQNGRAALARLEQNPADLAVLDVCMPFLTRLELLHTLRGQRVGIDAIMVTAVSDAPTVDTLLKLRVVDCLVKPFTYERFQQALGTFCRCRDAVAGDAVEQSVLDRLFSPALPAEHQPLKGLQENTLELVRVCLRAAPPQGLPSEVLSRQIGLPVVTAWRYVNYLIEWGEAISTANYDTGGRLCRLHRCPGLPAWISPPPMACASARNTRATGPFRLRSPSSEQKGKVQIPKPGSH